MKTDQLVKVDEHTPLLLRRAERKPDVDVSRNANGQTLGPFASHMTVVTTGGNQPEMHDQQEDASR